ncbi:MAG TPA: hypothetical protein VOA80_24470 [Thermoanaerobaculia bacterium]|nr:hypothetical protein [Thermoanaerobaculia bacterium]
MEVPSVSQPAVRTVEIAPPSARAETWNVLRAAALIVLATWIYIADTAAPAGSGVGGAAPGSAAAGAVASAATAGWQAVTGPGGLGGPGAPGAPGGNDARDLMPYQRLFRGLGGEDQRLFRELQEGLLEAENVRSSTRRWPAPGTLASRGVPPFADAAGRGGRRFYRWQLRQEGTIVNYLGLPADRRDPAFLLLVQEPDPGAPAQGSPPGGPAGGAGPAQGARAIGGGTAGAAAGAQATDEVHHRLADGTLLHVSVWLRESPSATPGAGAAGPSVAADDPGRDAGVIAVPYARGWTQVLVGATRQ